MSDTACKPGAVRYRLDRLDDDFTACGHGTLDTHGWAATIDGDDYAGCYCSKACAMRAAERAAERITARNRALAATGRSL